MKPRSALVVVVADQPTDLDVRDVESFRSAHEDVDIVTILLRNCNEPVFPSSSRLIRLPLDEAQRDTALAIGMQLCFNEGYSFVGFVESLEMALLEAASRSFRALQTGQTDVVLVAAAHHDLQGLFVAQTAAFIASFWAALGGELTGMRRELLCSIVGAAGRRAGQLDTGVSRPEVKKLGFTDLSVHGPHALQLRSKVGIEIGKLPKPWSSRVKKVAVITPYHREPPAELMRCMESVRTQSMACEHFMISDGFPSPEVEASGVTHIELGREHADNGNTPRYVGGLVALAQGFDAIAYLDADNWYHPKHVESLVRTQHETQATAVCSLRTIYLADGFKLDEADDEDLQRRHVDTSCLLITRQCEFIAHLWGQMPQSWGPVCDRVVYYALQRQRLAWSNKRTLNFKSNYRLHYRMAGRPLPEKLNDVPLGLWRAFAKEAPEFVELSRSRTGRMMRISL